MFKTVETLRLTCPTPRFWGGWNAAMISGQQEVRDTALLKGGQGPDYTEHHICRIFGQIM